MSGPTSSLAAVESWDLPALRASVAAVGEVPARLRGWQGRLDAVRGQLRRAELWSGPAADAAATALVELAAVGTEVGGALDAGAEELAVVAARAGAAQEEAAQARSWAAAGPVVLDDAGRVAPVGAPVMDADQLAEVAARERAATCAEQHARAAFAAADAAVLAAAGAHAALAGLGTGDVPTAFGPLALATAAGAVAPTVPVDLPAPAAAAWWDGLTPAARAAALLADPAGVGGLDGLPAAARDQANRQLLADALAHPDRPGYAVAVTTATQLAGREGVQLLLFDPAEDLVAVSVGDLDTAGAVGVLVPGMNTTPADDLPGLVASATSLGGLAQAAAPGAAVAVLVWLGYRTPSWGSFFSTLNARSSGPELDRTLDGLAAARAAGAAAGGPPPPRTTVVAHSYGTLVTGSAARAGGRLAADAVVLLGSPGTGSHDAADLEAGEVYGAWTPADPISWSAWFGRSPFDAGFGDTRLPTDPGQGHTEYLDADHPTLQAVAEVLVGRRDGG
ncbi:alpha/beta hydrolase [Klenkia brasiliensis]|uniref:Alpha/beta hydrolase n=1 Tax=Klenkia brasiliensis TaxID=333142 RepID=A0A1G7MAG2_9ACTN|nr:alpha/beta hydrolase [Klenkia brasiliensis]SDF58753.1 Alpha/beta hydrolase [Klenkia brasiliensis]